MNLAGLCGLAVLEELKVYEVKNGIYIGYADDGLILTNSESDVEEFRKKLNSEESGVMIKESKSRYIRKHGVDLMPLRFIGIEFDGRWLKANTRSGKEWSVRWRGESTEIPSSISEIRFDSRKYSISRGSTRTLDNNLKYLGTLFAKL